MLSAEPSNISWRLPIHAEAPVDMEQNEAVYYLVTGASRGIGLALVTKVLHTKPNAFVFATTRNACKDLEELGKKYRRQLLVLELDVGNETQYAGLMANVRTVTDRLDYVVANAGLLLGMQDCLSLPSSAILEAFKVNTCGPLYLYQATHSFLIKNPRQPGQKPPVFLITSSGAGCISVGPGIPVGAYGASKAAVNMLAREMHVQNEETGLVVIPYHPGWLQTDMGNRAAAYARLPEAPLTVDDGVDAMIELLDTASRDQHGGKFVGFGVPGGMLPW